MNMFDKSSLLLLCSLVFAQGRPPHVTPTFAFVHFNQQDHTYKIVEGIAPEDAVATGIFTDTRKDDGWTRLIVATNENYPDRIQAYTAGLLEGYLTRDIIDEHYNNTVAGYCDGVEEYCQRLYKYLDTNFNHYIQSQIDELALTDPYWHQVELFIIQMNALADGHINKPGQPTTYVSPKSTMLMFNINGDLEDIEVALNKPEKLRKGPLGSGSCSALVKLLPGNADIFFSQDTWSTYQSMLRVLKKYNFGYHQIEGSQSVIPGNEMVFSSYPATIYSGDDFYLLGSQMGVMETTIGNSNAALTGLIQPMNTVLESIRTQVSNRLAVNPTHWADVFSRDNSGTYNNQWMMFDFSKFTPGKKLSKGTFVVLEQLPGMIIFDDMSEYLQNNSYWASYNSPYFKEIFNMSGTQAAVDKFGDWFTHEKTPRALIFKRDQAGVKDVQSMMKLMRYNDYKNDPISKCNCTPPYSAENAISARSDLNPKNGSYPFGALGHRSHGGTDMKVTSYGLFNEHLNFYAQCGPTFDDQPPFSWLTADFADDTPHYGHPDVFQFEAVLANL